MPPFAQKSIEDNLKNHGTASQHFTLHCFINYPSNKINCDNMIKVFCFPIETLAAL